MVQQPSTLYKALRDPCRENSTVQVILWYFLNVTRKEGNAQGVRKPVKPRSFSKILNKGTSNNSPTNG